MPGLTSIETKLFSLVLLYIFPVVAVGFSPTTSWSWAKYSTNWPPQPGPLALFLISLPKRCPNWLKHTFCMWIQWFHRTKLILNISHSFVSAYSGNSYNEISWNYLLDKSIWRSCPFLCSQLHTHMHWIWPNFSLHDWLRFTNVQNLAPKYWG